MTRKSGLPPVIGDNPRLLILGTFPGEESLRQQRYYAHPRNAFWPIVCALLQKPLPETDTERHAMLMAHGIAVWDVLASAQRDGSLDSALKYARPNQLAELLSDTPSIKAIVFNGQAAARLFKRHVAPSLQGGASGPQQMTLPSTSPTNTKPFDAKLSAWKTAFAALHSLGSRFKP